MANILIITDRTSYFSFLGSYLGKKHKVFYIAVSKKDEALLESKQVGFLSLGKIYRDKKNLLVVKDVSPEEIEKTLIFELEKDRIFTGGLEKDKVIERGIRYYNFLSRFIRRNQINLIIVQNDLVGHSAIALKAAERMKIKTVIFEDGLFRPNTVTFDEKGVNYFNSLPREKTFFQNINIDQEKFKQFIREEKGEVAPKEVKFPFSFLDFLKLVLHPYRLKLYSAKFLTYLQDKAFRHHGIGTEYIFLPLQVTTDTQVLIHSSLRSMDELIAICLKGLKRYNIKNKSNLLLAVKEHPSEPMYDKIALMLEKYRKKGVICLKEADIKGLILGSKAVITINSTVGVEGLRYFKPVITLGKAFYNIEGISFHCDNFDKLDEVIEKAIKTGVNVGLISKFLFYLRFCYQTEGNLFQPDSKNILPVLTQIKKVMGNPQASNEI